jgi:hypothetical protein
MTMAGHRLDAARAPSADETRSALDHVLASDVFRGSPQLGAFLRYVVEATLRGEADRIKGYTVAIEALGRDERFDPQTDPIVRVEAARLRRAIGRYYAGAGSGEVIQIDLPLGSYVPVFRRVVVAARARAPFSLARLDWKRLATSAALVLIGAAIYALLDFWFDFNTPNRNTVKHGLVVPQACAQPPCPPLGAMAREN